MPYGYIYIIENLINGKVYVGQTSKLDDRRKAHLGGWSQPPAIAAAIRKYGKENFDFSIIQSCSSLEELNTQEIYWIAELGCLAPNGYNLKKGGECGGSLSEEVRQKISQSRKGKLRGSENHMSGKPLSEEHKKKISQGNKGKTAGEKNPCFGKFGLEHPRGGKTNSEEWRNQMREKVSGENSVWYGKRGSETPHFGKKHSLESKSRMSEALKKAWAEGRFSSRKPRKEKI